MRPPMTSLKFSGVTESEEELKGFGVQKSVKQGAMDLSVPVYSDEKSRVTLNGGYGRLDPSGADFGIVKRYERANFKATYSRRSLDQGLWVADVSYGSASDRIFEKSDVNTLASTLLYSNPTEFSGEGESRHPIKTWNFFLSYSNNRPFMNGIPLFGFAYSYMPSRDFRLMAGIPFVSLALRFKEKWEWNTFMLVPFFVRTKLSYDILPFIQAYGSFDYSQQTFLRYGRADRNDRIFYDEKKALIGISGPLARFVKLNIEGGYAFDRRFFEARNNTRPKTSKTNLGSSALFAATVEFVVF